MNVITYVRLGFSIWNPMYNNESSLWINLIICLPKGKYRVVYIYTSYGIIIVVTYNTLGNSQKTVVCATYIILCKHLSEVSKLVSSCA